MDTFKTKVKVKNNHKIQIDNVPFKEGETVEITINPINDTDSAKYPLWGTVYKFEDPFEPALSPDEWGTLNDPD